MVIVLRIFLQAN